MIEIEESTVRKIVIRGYPDLDPVAVVLENLAPGAGKITITCWGNAWTHYWSNMGEQHTVESFFSKCNTPYLVEKLSVNISRRVVDLDSDALQSTLRREVIRARRDGEITTRSARDLWDEIGGVDEFSYADDFYAVFGSDWWYHLPEKPNDAYTYLSRIVECVKAALQQMEQ